MKRIMSFRTLLRVRVRKTYLVVFLNGFLLALLLYFYMEDNYERKLFGALAANISQSVSSFHYVGEKQQEAILVKSLNLVYALEKTRSMIFGSQEISAWKSEYIQPITYDLMTGKDACGSYSYVLARLLTEMNIEVRIPQMKVDNKFGGHILVEAKTVHGWVILDPSFNLSYSRPDGKMASFEDVQKNWNWYKNQAPASYNYSYSYQDARYTNWEKIPVLMPMLREFLYWTWGTEKTDHFSMRTLFLKKFSSLLNITLILYFIFLFITIRMVIRRNIRMAALDPVQLFPKIKLAPRTA